MDFNLNVNQVEYKEKVIGLAKKFEGDFKHSEEDLDLYKSVLQRIAEEDLFKPLLGQDEKNLGISVPVVTARECFSRSFSFADFVFAEQALAIIPILLFGDQNQKEKYITPLVNGEIIGGFALTEETSGSDAGSLSCQAIREGDHYILNGKKVWISNAPIGDVFVVYARTGEHKTKGVSAFIINANETDIIRKSIELAAPHPIGELIFDNVKIHKNNLLGNEGEGFKIAMSTLDILRPGVGAHALGIAKSALNFTILFTQERMSFDQPLSSFQSIQFKLAEMYTKIRSAEWLVYHCAWKRDAGLKSSIESSMAKMYATEMANEVLYQCTQIHGAKGVVKDSHLEKLTRVVRPAAIYEGTTEVQKMVVHKQLTKMLEESGEIL